MKTKKVSENLSETVKLFDELKKQHDYAHERVGECDRKTIDYLHQIELGERKDRAKTTTALYRNLTDRREYKDTMEILSPIASWIEKYQPAVNALKLTLGDVRKQEKSHVNRSYHPRVVTDLEIAKKKKVEDESNE